MGPDPSRAASANPETLLGALERSDVLTNRQAHWLAERWDDLPQDWYRNPYFHTVCEHTVAFIGRGGPSSDTPDQCKRREETHV